MYNIDGGRQTKERKKENIEERKEGVRGIEIENMKYGKVMSHKERSRAKVPIE